MMNLPLIIASILPGLLIIWWVLRHDRYHHEPPIQLVICFVLGCFITVPIYFLQRYFYELAIFDTSSSVLSFFYAFGVVALSEETAKFLVLRGYIYPHKDFDEPLDGIVYAVMIGMGFACVENALYAMQHDWETILVRSVTAVPAHASFAIISGYYLGKAKFDPINRRNLLINAFVWPIVAHGLYDFCIVQDLYDWLLALSLPILMVCMYLAWQLIKEYDEKMA